MGEPSPPLYNASSPDQVVSVRPASIPLRSILDDLPANSTARPVTLSGTGQKRLHVSNIPFKWRETHLQTLFGAFGEVEDASVVTNERGSKGYGFISFLNAASADEAIAALNGREFGGRAIQVTPATCRRVIPQRKPAGNTSNVNEQYSPDLEVLLLKQKQMLAQQQQLQFLIAQQQSDLIANALGLPTSNLSGLLAGSLPYTATAALSGLNMDPYALQLQQQQSLSLLQQLQQQAALSTQQQYSAYSQSPAVAAAYSLSHSYGAANIKTEIGPQPLDPTLAMYTSSENSVSSSSLRKSRSRGDVTSQRFNPY